MLIAIAFLFVHAWIQEHDARLLAEQEIKRSEQQVQDLQKTIATTDATAAKQVSSIHQLETTTMTPQAQIAAIPTLTDIPLNARPGPTLQTAVVDVQPLFQELAECKQDQVKLQACQADYQAEIGIAAQKDDEVKALKKKPRFWKRVGGALKTAAIGAIAAEALHILIRGAL
ncbi:MAG TPA: hypothetical protein VE866_15280 [Candidatus Binatia bacterium]|nr:hypothetical protein [Candidatus Binatia bacterium]